MDYLPVFLQLRAAPAVIVGGGRIAARKAELLIQCGASLTVVAPQLNEELHERAARGELTHRAEPFIPEHLDGAALVIAATHRPEINSAGSAAARARGVPVHVVDDAALSTFIVPAIIDRSPV